MTDKKFTQEQIIKALKCCCEMENMDCLQCPYFSVPFKSDCVIRKTNDVIKLINYLTTTNKNHEVTIKRADELIDTLKTEIERLLPFGCQVEVSEKIEKEIKTEAIKEFWDKAKQTREFRTCPYVYVLDGDNLVKEMTEGKNDFKVK